MEAIGVSTGEEVVATLPSEAAVSTAPEGGSGLIDKRWISVPIATCRPEDDLVHLSYLDRMGRAGPVIHGSSRFSFGKFRPIIYK